MHVVTSRFPHNFSFINRMVKIASIGLITVFGATFTGRQSGQKFIQRLYGNLIANNFSQN